MLGYMTPGTMKRTIEGGDVWFYSRSRSDLWHKGEVSGNYMRVRSVSVDCDGDTVLLKVDPDGPICHTGNPSCFFTSVGELPRFEKPEGGPGVLEELFSVVQDRKQEMPEGSYTTTLFREGIERISQKVIEEAGETAIAGVGGDSARLISENGRPPLPLPWCFCRRRGCDRRMSGPSFAPVAPSSPNRNRWAGRGLRRRRWCGA